MKKFPYLVRKICFDTKYSGLAKAAVSGPKTRSTAHPGLFRAFLRRLALGRRICRLHHIFRKNAVAPGGVVYQHMRHRAHQPAVLQDGAAAHE